MEIAIPHVLHWSFTVESKDGSLHHEFMCRVCGYQKHVYDKHAAFRFQGNEVHNLCITVGVPCVYADGRPEEVTT